MRDEEEGGRGGVKMRDEEEGGRGGVKMSGEEETQSKRKIRKVGRE